MDGFLQAPSKTGKYVYALIHISTGHPIHTVYDRTYVYTCKYLDTYRPTLTLQKYLHTNTIDTPSTALYIVTHTNCTREKSHMGT